MKFNLEKSQVNWPSILLHAKPAFRSHQIFNPETDVKFLLLLLNRLFVRLSHQARAASHSIANAYATPHTHRRQLNHHAIAETDLLLRDGDGHETWAATGLTNTFVEPQPASGELGHANQQLSASLLSSRSTASGLQSTLVAATKLTYTSTVGESDAITTCGSSASRQLTGTLCDGLWTNASANRAGICSTSCCFDEPLDPKCCDLSATHASSWLSRLSATTIGSTQWHGSIESHWRGWNAPKETIHLQVLQSPVHQILQSSDPWANAHWRASLQLWHLRQSLPSPGSSERSSLHSFQREALQVQWLRQRLLPIAHPRRPQSDAPWRVTAQVSSVQSQLQPTRQPQDSHANPHELIVRAGAQRHVIIDRSDFGFIAKVINTIATQESVESASDGHHKQETTRFYNRWNYETIKCDNNDTTRRRRCKAREIFISPVVVAAALKD